MNLRIIKISGYSLYPDYLNGDFVIILKIPFFYDSYKPGDLIVFKQQEYGLMIKVVEEVSRDGDTISVTGTYANSLDSRQFGEIKKKDIIGKVIYRIKK